MTTGPSLIRFNFDASVQYGNDHSRFTDDTVLTVAVADGLLHGRDYIDALHDYFDAYPDAGYGGTFWLWAISRRRSPYQSWGNGSAMLVRTNPGL